MKKVRITKEKWERIGIKAGFMQRTARRSDSHGRPINLNEKYILKKKVHGMDDPCWFSNGSLRSPELVFLANEALKITGSRLEDLNYDWDRDWWAVKANDDAYDPKLPLQETTGQK